MPEIGLILDREPAWPDLEEKRRRKGKLIHLTGRFEVTGLRGGMTSGLASVAFRFDLPGGRTVIAETSLRALYSATMGLAARFGEPFMTGGKPDDLEMKQAFALEELTRQLVEAKVKRGEPPVLDLSAADRRYDEYVKAKGAQL